MSAAEFHLPSQSSVSGLSLVRPTCYEKLSQHRTHSELDRNSARMELLADLNSCFVGDAEPDLFLRQMMTKIQLMTTSDLALLGLSNYEDEQLLVKSFHTNNDLPLSRECTESLGELLWEHVLSTGRQWTGKLGDMSMSPTADREWMGVFSMNSCVLPLVARDRVLGVLALGRRDDSDYTQDELMFFGLVASQIAVITENFRLFAELQKLKADFDAGEKPHVLNEPPPAGTSARYPSRLASASIPRPGRRCRPARVAFALTSSLDFLQGTFEKIRFQRLVGQHALQLGDLLS